ncbi:MAG UNVERIFIED_CONTAM: DotU family type IV/VI secretion system protein [Planctomycetaceae bacterium]
MSRSLVRLAEPFFLKVLALVNQPGNCSPEELENLQRKLMADLQSIESRLLADQPTGSPDWEVGKRLLIYWADEVLTLRFPDWQDLVLEHRYFEEKTAPGSSSSKPKKESPEAAAGSRTCLSLRRSRLRR